jgi:hypothetical protein
MKTSPPPSHATLELLSYLGVCRARSSHCSVPAHATADPVHRRTPPSAQGHVLGLGTIWDIRGCESGCKPNSPAGTMNYYK